MDGGLVTMDGSTIKNCRGTASSDVHSSRVVGPLGRCLVCGWCGGCLVLLGGGKEEGERVCVCVCATWESMVWFRICVC